MRFVVFLSFFLLFCLLHDFRGFLEQVLLWFLNLEPFSPFFKSEVPLHQVMDLPSVESSQSFGKDIVLGNILIKLSEVSLGGNPFTG